METILEEPIWTGAIFFILGVLATLVITVRSKDRANPVYAVKSLRIIEASPRPGLEDMDVIFDGEIVPRLTKTVVIVWNRGQKTITNDDAVTSDPMRFTFPANTQVLRVRTLKVTRPVINFRASVVDDWGSNCVVCSFDFLDKNDGSTFEILHTGDASEPIVAGTIRGVPKGLRKDKTEGWDVFLPARPRKSGIRGALSQAIGMWSGPVLLWIFAGLFFALSFQSPRGSGERSFLLFLGFATAAGGVALIWSFRRRFPESLNARGEV